MSKSFSGNMAMCLSQWISTIPTERAEYVKMRRLLMEYLGAKWHTTAEHWLSGKPPRSHSSRHHLKMQFFFRDVLGYEVEELERLGDHSQLHLRFAEVVAYSALDVGVLARRLNYKNSWSIYRLVSGVAASHPRREVIIRQICKECASEVKERRSYWRQQFGSSVEDQESVVVGIDAVLPTLITLLGAISPLVKSLTNGFGPEGRARFRARFGEQNLRAVTEDLLMLRSEVSRDRVRFEQARRSEDFDLSKGG